jgi:hypothetical protein
MPLFGHSMFTSTSNGCARRSWSGDSLAQVLLAVRRFGNTLETAKQKLLCYKSDEGRVEWSRRGCQRGGNVSWKYFAARLPHTALAGML